MTLKRGFEPVLDERTRVLILGSLPGDASLGAGQYYGRPTNAFWFLIGRIIDRDLVGLPYPERLVTLGQRGVGLWDVIASAERPGSLDAAIRRPEAANLGGLISTLPNLRAIGFNGGTAARRGRVILARHPGSVTLIDLPSSSAAHAGKTREEKARAWAVLRPFLSGA